MKKNTEESSLNERGGKADFRMIEGPIPVSQKIWHLIFTLALAAFFLGVTAMMIVQGVDRFRTEQLFQWIKFLPLLVMMSIVIALFAIKSLVMFFRRFDPENPSAYRAPVFRFESQLVTVCVCAAIISPFLLQPFIDYVFTPAFGYEFCEILSSGGPTFGFPTYAYVPDLELCVASDSSG